MMESTTSPVYLSYTQHLSKAYVSRNTRFIVMGVLLLTSFATMQALMRGGDILGPLIAFCMFGGLAGAAIGRLHNYILTVIIDDIGISATISDVLSGHGQRYRWEEIGSVTVRPVNIKREFGQPGFHFSGKVTFMRIRDYGRKVSYIWDGTEAIELRMRDGRIAIITVSDGDAVRAALEAAEHPAS